MMQVEEQPLPPYGANTELSNQEQLSSGTEELDCMKKIGFLSFGHWAPSPQSRTQSATDALLQSIDLAMEAERLGMDGAYFRVHHFAQQLASPFPYSLR